MGILTIIIRCHAYSEQFNRKSKYYVSKKYILKLRESTSTLAPFFYVQVLIIILVVLIY